MEATIIDAPARVPWNKRRFTGQKPPLKLKEIWAIRELKSEVVYGGIEVGD
jgi:hypothetical protein